MSEEGWINEEKRLLDDLAVGLDPLNRQKLQILVDFYLEYVAHVAKVHAAKEVGKFFDRVTAVNLN